MGANIITSIRLSSGDLANSSNKNELLSVNTMQFASTLNFDLIENCHTEKLKVPPQFNCFAS